jgi:PDZ domain-containing protein
MKWLLKHKFISVILILLYASFTVLFTYRLDDYTLTLKGDLTPVKTEILETDTHHFYTIYVVSMDKPTIFQYFLATLTNTIDILRLPDAYRGMSAMDQFKMGQIAEEISYQYATIQAYTKANLVDANIQIDYAQLGYIVSFVERGQTGIRLGDILIEVEGVSHHSVPQNEFFGYFSNLNTVNVKVLRDGVEMTLTLNKLSSIDRYGIRLEPYFEIETTPNISTTYGDDFIGGPSGGMIQTLDIYMKLLNIDLKQLKIAGTGTIELDGTIGEIGGIEQKIYTAYDHNVDLFLCAADNYDAALAVYQKLNQPTFTLIKVGDIDEAIQSILSRLS